MDSFQREAPQATHSEPSPPRSPRRSYARIFARSKIEPWLYEQMWSLFEAHYDGVSWDAFMRDIKDKSHVILIFDQQSKALCGFSTLSAKTHKVGQKRYRVVFSGDTIIASSHRGSSVLTRAFFRFMLGQWLRFPQLPLRWLLISKGYKTYLLLTRNYLEFYPTYKRPTPPRAQQLLEEACRARFKDAYLPDLGIIRFDAQHGGQLKPRVAPIGARELEDPDIAFFVNANPGHRQGDELACLGYFTPWMILHFLRRTFVAKKRRA